VLLDVDTLWFCWCWAVENDGMTTVQSMRIQEGVLKEYTNLSNCVFLRPLVAAERARSVTPV